MKTETTTQPPAAGVAAHTPTLEVRFDDRHNRADIYVGNLLIGEAYTGGKNPSTRERTEWAKAVRACNAYDSDQRELERLRDVECRHNAALRSLKENHEQAVADQRKIKALEEAGERLLQWVEGYQRLANEKGGVYAVAISSARSDAELFRAAIALAKEGR